MGHFMSVCSLFLSLISGSAVPISTKSNNEKPPVLGNTSSAAGESHIDRLGIDDKGSKTLDCDDAKAYSLEEGTIPDTHSVNIVRDGTVLHTIKLFTERDVPGFAFDGAKKARRGFEISIEYGTRIFYHKTFVFLCRQHKFYLSKIRVESFDKRNPEKWSRKVVNVQPNVRLEKFSVRDFMAEVFSKN